MRKCLGSPSGLGVRLPSARAQSPAPPPGSHGPRTGSSGAGQARRPWAAMFQPGWGLASSVSQWPPPALQAALPHQEAIPERSCKAPGSGSGEELSKGPPGNLGCQTRAGVTPPGVCLPSDRWEGSWLLSAFRGDRARLEQPGSMALPLAGWLPGGQGMYFKSLERKGWAGGDVRFELIAEAQP